MFRFSWIVAVVFVLDQLTKIAAERTLVRAGTIEVAPFFNLVLVYNKGAAFGFLGDAAGWQNLFFIIVTVIVCLVIIIMIRRLTVKDTQAAVALMLVLGGATGNLADRLRLGYVIDFIDIYYRSWHWPAFNIADSAITIGVILLLLDTMGWSFRGKRG